MNKNFWTDEKCNKRSRVLSIPNFKNTFENKARAILYMYNIAFALFKNYYLIANIFFICSLPHTMNISKHIQPYAIFDMKLIISIGIIPIM